MTAVTKTSSFDVAPAHEYCILTISEAYTYESKLSHPYAVFASYAEDIDGYINATISGRTITFHTTGTAAKKVYVDIVGNL